MAMSDNARYVFITLIIAMAMTITFCISVISDMSAKLSHQPIVFRIEADDNMVQISKAMSNTTITKCETVKVECSCSTPNVWSTPYYWNINNNTYNYSSNWSKYWNNPSIVYVSSEYK